MIERSNLPQISQPLPWHEQQWGQLTAQLATGRMPHALLLTGREHIGKAQFALALSRLLLCAQPQGSLNCGICHACELSATGNHGDLRWVEPIEPSRVIKIDQIREVVRFTGTTAGLGSRKVIVVAPADRMNANAYNALLKSLEEPAPDSYLILVCNQMQNVPSTIRSRCQLSHMVTPGVETCLQWLNKITSNPELSESLLGIADGLPLLAQKLYLNNKAEEFMAGRHALDSLAAGAFGVPEVAQFWGNQEIGAFLELLGAHLQLKIGKLSGERLKLMQARAMFSLLDEVHLLRRSMSSGANPNKQLLVLGLLSKYQRLLGAI